MLAAAIKQIGEYDLIICGERATDGDTGQVGPGIAAFLDLPVASYVGNVDEMTDKTVQVHRLVEDGHEVLQLDLPAVLTVVKEVINDGRQPADGLVGHFQIALELFRNLSHDPKLFQASA